MDQNTTLTIVGFDGGAAEGSEKFIVFRPHVLSPVDGLRREAPWFAISREGARHLMEYLAEQLAQPARTGPAGGAH